MTKNNFVGFQFVLMILLKKKLNPTCFDISENLEFSSVKIFYICQQVTIEASLSRIDWFPTEGEKCKFLKI